jgi:proline iminopeptidase
MLDIGNGLKLWYHTWGNREGIPVLFVHGGPGNCVADYKGVNAHFFEPERYFVVEVDQRGTGNSTPSVREGHEHMKHYLDISIDKMSTDFEKVREKLEIEKWLVFGGSWGSTLGIQYAEDFPARCLGLIVRGIFLNSKAEHDEIFARESFEKEGSERQLKEFDIFFEPAREELRKKSSLVLNPNDSEQIVRLYEELIQRGDRNAIWRFRAFEDNLMEEDPT